MQTLLCHLMSAEGHSFHLQTQLVVSDQWCMGVSTALITVSLLALVLGGIEVMRGDIIKVRVQPLLTERPSYASVPKEQRTVF